MSMSAVYFDRLFAEHDDPWAFRQRWYEQRKRDLIMASLPHQQYQRSLEVGCANGELSLALAERSSDFLGMDLCQRAVELARDRLAGCTHARIEQGDVPRDWPQGCFDLIVLSEVGYYLTPGHWAHVVQHAERSLHANGVLLACHWLQPIQGCPMQGDQVHQLLHRELSLPHLLLHQERDFVLEIWTADASVPDLQELVN